MINIIYQIFLTINSTSLIFVVFMIKEHRVVYFLNGFPNCISSLFFIFIPFILSGISLVLTKWLSDDNIDGNIKEVELANNTFLPSYLGYFFVAISVSDCETLIYVFIMIFVFTYFSQTLYFNPLFLIFGYKFYYMTSENNIKIFLITKKEIRGVKGLRFIKLKRINNYTYIDLGGKNESFNS